MVRLKDRILRRRSRRSSSSSSPIWKSQGCALAVPNALGCILSCCSASVSLGLALHTQLTPQVPLDDLVISPVSIILTLAMATNCTRGRTETRWLLSLALTRWTLTDGTRITKKSYSSLRQLTFLDINERGADAAAATRMMMMRSLMLREPSSPFLMVVDRPFFLAIRDQLSGLLLFTGSVVES